MLDWNEQFLPLSGLRAQSFNLHELVELLLHFEVADGIFLEGAPLSHVYDYTDYPHILFKVIQ